MSYIYTTSGTCSREISFDVLDGKVSNVSFVGGCNGNSQGVSRLVEGMDIDEVIRRTEHINCNGRGTSCPDQLANALKLYKQKAIKSSPKKVAAAQLDR